MQRIIFLICVLWAGCAGAGQAIVKDVRLWAAPDHTRVVLDVSRPVSHSLLVLRGPDRIVIDLRDARLSKPLRRPVADQGWVRGIRSAPRNGKDLRIVLDLGRRVNPKSFLLKPNESYGHRLVIDLNDDAAVTATRDRSPAKQTLRDLVIAIDAGHGGEDPGAVGRDGTREKDVVLAVARRLARMINRESGMRAVLIRDGDYYVGLGRRVQKARAERADMFISIHADAVHNRQARGSSVYTLSHKGATNEAARWLAERENASDYIGGVSLEDKGDLLTRVLLELSQNGTIEASLELAEDVLRQLKHIGPVHKDRPHQAAFVVLRAPDIPSILVETAFISNPAEERKLRQPRFQQRLAESILQGVRAYFNAHPVPGTVLAGAEPVPGRAAAPPAEPTRTQAPRTQAPRVAAAGAHGRRHIIARGDTLFSIARRYAVSLRTLRVANRLKTDRLRVGDVLRIPGNDI